MDELPDYDLHSTPGESIAPARSPARTIGLRIAVILLIAATAAAIYVVLRWQPAHAPSTAVTPAAPTGTTPVPALGSRDASVDLPPLDSSDSAVRALVQ